MRRREALERLALLSALPANERESLDAEASLVRLRKRENVWNDGEPPESFNFVVGGRVKLVHALESGREVILDFVEPGGLLCGNAVYGCSPYCCSAVVDGGDAEVLSLPRATVLRLIERYPAAARAFLDELTCRGTTLCRRVGEVASGKVEQRIATMLMRFAEKLGEVRSDGTLFIPLGLSRQDIADLCGTTVESAIRAMSRLGKDGVVETEPDGFVVRRGDLLRRVADGKNGA